MTNWIQGSFGHHDEVNVVFARGMSLDALDKGLRDLHREPLALGEGNGWVWAVHDMLNPDIDDYDAVDYTTLCRDGGEIVVFVTEPCSVKGFPPDFEYYRDGRLILRFSFEDLEQRVGQNPDYLSPELLAANLIGPDAGCDQEDVDGHECYVHARDHHEPLVKVIADFFALPSPPLAMEVTAK
ncbi:hypothetical protein ACFYWX_31565 [Streptomyces sp. NPDC002888]|uniref:hypothetical protein n=1 Tax=Streptomyces sp. NPDC002888 TaxID=3364668 RepID=UPI0036852BBC